MRRSGTIRSVSLQAVVPGDIIELSAGDLVPGDARVIDARGLYMG